MSRKPHHNHPIEVRLEIGRRYEIGRLNRTKVLIHEYGISPGSLAKMAAEYRAHAGMAGVER